MVPWGALCVLLGVQTQANGRAERAGQQIFERLRREKFEQGLTWVDVLPQFLDRIHDTPGEGYKILFGRERHLAGVPYQPPVESEDAIAFLKGRK